jgi:hypothetical protein
MSTPINDGGPAFPCGPSGTQITGDDGHSWWQFPASDGMSLRQHFAGLAMAALLSREDTIANGAEELMHRELARLAYQQADAMIAAGEAK